MEIPYGNSIINLLPYKGVDEKFLSMIRGWIDEVLRRVDSSLRPSYLRIEIWEGIEDLKEFYRREKAALGAVTGEESDFLATHEAWRGYPRIHMCHERLKGVGETVIEGVLHHEMGHALFHGSKEFYTFRFTQRLQEKARLSALSLPHLQHCVYFLSIALKDWEVVQWLAEAGLGRGQQALLEYMMNNTEEERTAWETARSSPAVAKIVKAGLLKVILPIEALISIGCQGGQDLKNQWNQAYGWLSASERQGLIRLSRRIMGVGGVPFQDRLDKATQALMDEP